MDDQRHTSFFNQKLDSLAELIQNDLDEIKMALKTCQPRKKPTREYLERIAADLGYSDLNPGLLF
jgi:hypothetical protein